MLRMFMSWEDRDDFVENNNSSSGGGEKKKTIIRSGSVSGMQHLAVWRDQESEDTSPQVIQKIRRQKENHFRFALQQI